MPVLEFIKEALSGLRSEQSDEEESDKRSDNPKLYETLPETPDCLTAFLVFSHRSRKIRA
jgi:hypothetical protein